MTARLFFVGLLTAQAISVIHVRLSNISYYQKVKGVLEAGYVSVPNPGVAETLTFWRPAFFGGLFFTLTIGLGLTLLTIPAARQWRKSHRWIVPVRMGIACLWIGLVGLLNSNGFSISGTAYGVLIPLAVFIASARLPEGTPPILRSRPAIHLIGLALLAVVGARHMDTALFSGIRDNLLLSNSVGIRINNFYYHYTLYAAQAFKSLDQDLLRSCRIMGMAGDPAGENRLRQRLARLDWLVVEGKHRPDMVVMHRDQETLAFSHNGQDILLARTADFMGHPEKILREFSAKTDRDSGLRWLAFVSLMALSPLAFYAMLYVPVRFIAGRFIGPRAAVAAAVAFAVVGGTALLSLVSRPPLERYGTALDIRGGEELRTILDASDADIRIAGLAYIYRNRLEAGKAADLWKIAESPDLRERCWLAKALSFSRNPDTLPILLTLLDDPQINVAYQACRALGRRADPRGLDALLELIGRSPDWYVQLYAYRAIRRLGWHQNGSG